MWCSIFMQTTGSILHANIAAEDFAVGVGFSMGVCLLLLPLSVLPTFLGFLVMLRPGRVARVVSAGTTSMLARSGGELQNGSALILLAQWYRR